VCINFDETCIPLIQSSHGGLLVHDAALLQRSPQSLTRDVSRAEMRTNLTYVAFISDDPAIQHLLPQFIIVSKRTLCDAAVVRLKDHMPESCILLRQDKAWVSQNTLIYMFEEISRRLRPLSPDVNIIVYADAYRAHICSRVLRTYGRLYMRFVCIPAGLTWVLQPCDTHLFALLKHHYRIQSEVANMSARRPGVNVVHILTALGAAIDHIMQRTSWSSAFRGLGLCGHQALVSARVRHKLSLPDVPIHLPHGLPSLQQLELIFPRKAAIPIMDVFAFFTVKRRSSESIPITEGIAHSSPVSSQRVSGYATRSKVALSREASSVGSIAALPCQPNSTSESRTLSSSPFLPNAKRMRLPRALRENSEAPPLPPPAMAPPTSSTESHPSRISCQPSTGSEQSKKSSAKSEPALPES